MARGAKARMEISAADRRAPWVRCCLGRSVTEPPALFGVRRRCCDYLELDTRVEVLNTRCGVLSDMFGEDTAA